MKWTTTSVAASAPDEEYLARYQHQSDLDALALLFDRYVDMVFGVCVKYLKDPAQSEDAAMEIFEVLRQKLRTHHVDSFRSWLYTVTRNHCLQILRKQKGSLTEVYDEKSMQFEAVEHPQDDFDIPTDNGLMDCVEKLPAAQKQSIELFYFQSKSYQEIADLLTIDKEMIRSHLQNGRRNLRLCMEKKTTTR